MSELWCRVCDRIAIDLQSWGSILCWATVDLVLQDRFFTVLIRPPPPTPPPPEDSNKGVNKRTNIKKGM